MQVVSSWEMLSITIRWQLRSLFFFLLRIRDQSCLPEAFKYFLVAGIIWSGHRLGFLFFIIYFLWSVTSCPSLSPRIPSGICSFIFKQRRTPFLWSPLPSTRCFCVQRCHHHTFTLHTCANSASRDSAPHPLSPCPAHNQSINICF